ncbi:MAG: hypothetical protein FWH19_01460 [Treponema sp.]|nr:hypothetical protein [Treponema sp.]
MDKYLNLFADINEAKTENELSGIFKKYKLNRKNKERYPDIEFDISIDEINDLKKTGIITENNIFDLYLSKNKQLTSLEKLLYSMLWKQGDLKKEKHIILGIYNIDTGTVFNQFGKYLRDKNNLIIDQHVIRSFIYFTINEIEIDIKAEHFTRFSDLYVNWIKSNALLNSNKNLIDELLFSLGQKLKKEEKKRKE